MVQSFSEAPIALTGAEIFTIKESTSLAVSLGHALVFEEQEILL